MDQSNQATQVVIRWLANRVTVGIVAAWIVTLLGFAGSLHWFADAMNHPRWHLAWLCGMAALVCGWASKKRWMIAALACVLVLVTSVRPWFWYLPVSSVDAGDPTIRTLFWNINTGTRNTRAIIDVIQREDPDVVSLLELNHDHLPGLAELRASHPFFKEMPGADAFGLGVYSKYSMQWMDVASEPPIILGRLRMQDLEVDVWTVHTLPPIGEANRGSRNEQLRNLAKQVVQYGSADRHTVVGGDFNITP